MNNTRILYPPSPSHSVTTPSALSRSVTRSTGSMTNQTPWRSPVALVDHPSDAPPA